MYFAEFSHSYIAWCVFKKEELSSAKVQYHSGPFNSKEEAEHEADLQNAFHTCSLELSKELMQ